MNEMMICEYVVPNHAIKRIEGKLLATVESIGLPEKQENAVKGLVRQALWEPFNDPNTPIVYEGDFHKMYRFLEELRAARVQGSEASATEAKPPQKKSK
jgi:hypothetical protein